jgi:chromosome partitioning protein
LADEWHRQGKSVLLIELDHQGSALEWAAVAQENEVDGPTVVRMGLGFHSKLPTLSKIYDAIVIDCPPKLAQAQSEAFMVSDLTIIPCGPGTTDVWSLRESLGHVRQAQIVKPTLHAALLVTRVDQRTQIGRSLARELEAFEMPIFSTALGYRVDYAESPGAGVGVTRYNFSGTASREFRRFVREVEAILTAEVELEEAV